jgi:hypothetical protein
MTSNQKKNAMVFLGVSILITVLLAANLSQMELKPGLPAPLLEGYHIIVPEVGQRLSFPTLPFILKLLGIVSVIYLLVILFKAIMGLRLKKIAGILSEFILIVGGFLILILGIFLLQKLPGQPTAPTPMPFSFDTPRALRTESIPTSTIWLVGFSLAVLAALLLYYWLRAHRRSSQKDLLMEQIERARRNIYAGMDLDEVILRCYSEMGLIIQREGGIERQAFTTPSEFESELCSAGLPRQPIHELTHLFESVRYGVNTPTRADEQAALYNLEKIITYMREKKAVVNAD